MDLELDGSTAFVAASSKGLGLASAKRLAMEGGNVVISSRRAENLEAASAEIVDAPGVGESQVHSVVCDLTERSSIQTAIEATVETFGGLDVLVNNHGGPPAVTFEEATEQQWDDAFSGVVKSNIRLARAGLPHLRESEHGSLVVVTSASAREPGENHALSNVFRLGLYGLTKTIAVEYAPDVRANCVTPRFIMTDRIEYKIQRRAEHRGISVDEALQSRIDEVLVDRHGTPEEFATAVAYLASPKSGYVTGDVLSVDGGWSRHVL